LQVRVSVPNPDRFLRPGLFVHISVASFDSPEAIRIPQQAVVELQGIKSVFVVGAGDKVEARQITAALRVDSDWVVDGGLKSGDRVVVEGVGKVRPGVQVKAVTAALVPPSKT
jgi:membrane fusion protein (multidrug efflux system)